MKLHDLYLILFLSLLCILPVQVHGAAQFDGTDHISVADDAGFTFPDGDWAVHIRIDIASSTSAARQRILYWSEPAGGNVINFFITENLGVLDELRLYWEEIDGTILAIESTTSPFAADPGTVSIVAQRVGTTHTLYINAVQVATGSDANLDGMNIAAPFYIGQRDNGIDKFSGDMSDFAIWNRSLSAAEIQSLAAGFSPVCLPWNPPPKKYWPMIADTKDIAGASATTNSGTVPVAHPRMYFCGE